MSTSFARFSLAGLTLSICAAAAGAWQNPDDADYVDPVAMPLPPKAMCFWKGDSFLPKSMPDDVPVTALSALEQWWEFAFENDYRIDIEREGRVVMLSDWRDRRTRKKMILAEDTLDLFDLHLPDEPLDVEETMSTPRLSMPVPSTESVVLLRMRDRADLLLSLQHLASLEPELEQWSEQVAGGHSYWLANPAVAAWMIDPDIEEWREDNELVNRFSQCLLEGRFGRQPHWLAQGVAWYAELEVADGIYCFPAREGFVGVTEHGGWESDLRRAFRKRKADPLAVEELAAWQRGTYDEQSAALAWGMVTFLIEDCLDEDELENEEEDRILADVAREMGAHRQTFGVRTFPDGRWETVPDFELSAEVQRQILEHHAGTDLWNEATRSFWMGSRYKPSRTR